MLVLLGPTFEGTDDEYARLVRATGLVTYDLRTRLKAGLWGVVRALADAGQAEQLAARLRADGFQVALVDPAVAFEPERRAVMARGLRLQPEQLTVVLHDREMVVPYRALLALVRGQIRLGSRTLERAASVSSSSMRAVTPADLAALRAAQSSGQFDAYCVADIHFITVSWLARIDARNFDFASLGLDGQSPAQALDTVVQMLSERAGVRVDRGSRVSSVASFAGLSASRADMEPPSSSQRRSSAAPHDEPFGAYSRLVAEAERQTRGFRQQNTAS